VGRSAIRRNHNIAAYIGDDSVDNALLVMARIAETAELLAQTPNIGRV
jgi:plasmid stabilization system protein ParE